MHNNDSFIEEVSEEVRRDRFYAWLRRWRWLLIALVVLIVGAAAVNEWRKLHWASRSQTAGDAFRAAYGETDAAARAAAFGGLAASNARAAVLAKLAEAGAKAEAGDTEGAAALLAEVAGDGAAGELYRALASLQRVMLLGNAMAASERQATLELLTNPGAPFRPLALEQRALMHLDAGDKAAAIADLGEALAEPGASEALRTRARQLIVASGGTVPAPAPVAAGG